MVLWVMFLNLDLSCENKIEEKNKNKNEVSLVRLIPFSWHSGMLVWSWRVGESNFKGREDQEGKENQKGEKECLKGKVILII